MGRRLRSFVHVPVGLDWVVYGPGDEVPADHAELITNPKAWQDNGERPVASEPESPLPTSDDDKPQADGSADPPRRSGPGSGRDDWAAYAARHGIHVDDDERRDDIIAALDTAGIRTQ